jgi:hypothetical protein
MQAVLKGKRLLKDLAFFENKEMQEELQKLLDSDEKRELCFSILKALANKPM